MNLFQGHNDRGKEKESGSLELYLTRCRQCDITVLVM